MGELRLSCKRTSGLSVLIGLVLGSMTLVGLATFASESLSQSSNDQTTARITTYCGYFGEEARAVLQAQKPWDKAPSASQFKEFSSRLSEAFTLVQKYASTDQVAFDDIRLAAVPSTAAGNEVGKGKNGDERPKRLILINNNFMESIFAYALSDRLNRNTITGELFSGQRYDWPLITVIAHHFGYHLYGDSFDGGCNPRNVLRADWHSGNLLRQMQAPLSQAAYLIHQFAPACGTRTHPAREERLLALVAGYQQACEKDKASCNATAVLEDLKYLQTERPVADCDGTKRASQATPDYGLICKVGEQSLLVDLPESMERSARKSGLSRIGTIYRRKTIVPSDAPEVIGQFIHRPNASRVSQSIAADRADPEPDLDQCTGLLVLEQTTWHDMKNQTRDLCGASSQLPAAMACFQETATGGTLLDFTGRGEDDACRVSKSPVIGTCRNFRQILKPPKFDRLCSVGGQQYLVDDQNLVYDRRLLEPGTSAKFIGTVTGKGDGESGSALCGQTLEIPWETVCVRTENPFAKQALRCDPKTTYRMRSLCLNSSAEGGTSVSVRRDGNVVVGSCVSCKDNPLCPGQPS